MSMEEKANEIMSLILKGIENGADLVAEEAPQVFQEYITYLMIQELPVVSFVSIIMFSLILLSLRKYMSNRIAMSTNEIKKDEIELTKTIVTVLISLIITAIACGFIDGLRDVFTIKYAPKAYIIEEVRGSHNCGSK